MSIEHCPLCGQRAKLESTADPKGQLCTCPECVAFWIDDYAMHYLASIAEPARTEMLQQLSISATKTAPGNLYVVRQPKPSEITGDGHKVARTSLVSEWISRSSHRS